MTKTKNIKNKNKSERKKRKTQNRIMIQCDWFIEGKVSNSALLYVGFDVVLEESHGENTGKVTWEHIEENIASYPNI